MGIRERIVKYARVRAGDLIRHPKNWRRHPEAQQKALMSIFERIGNVAPLITFRMSDGSLCLIDGHLRADIRPDEEVEVAVTDLTEEEADLVLATFDPISLLAEVDEEKLTLLKESVDFSGIEDLGKVLDQLVEDVNEHSIGQDAGEEEGNVEGREYDENSADNVEYVICPECGHRWPK